MGSLLPIDQTLHRRKENSEMYNIKDTIVAVSSPPLREGAAGKSILRLSGTETFSIITDVFNKPVASQRGIIDGTIHIEENLKVRAIAYLFIGPKSYTGEDLAELHILACRPVVEKIFQMLLTKARPAGPGEFTLRAYLNGKMDLSQAEAVAEIVASSNTFQLAAAERLLEGKLCETIATIRTEILDVLSLIEAGMDFSGEGIEFITQTAAIETIRDIKQKLQQILSGSIRCEEMIDMPSVGLAGRANAGKSSLLNALLGEERSIVSDQQATTRDILTGLLEMQNSTAAIFDCAGLGIDGSSVDLLDELGRQAAKDALKKANVILFCVDLTRPYFQDDISVTRSFDINPDIVVATKTDLLNKIELTAKQNELKDIFACDVITTSSLNGAGLAELKVAVEKKIAAAFATSSEAADRISINKRHRLIAEQAIENLSEAADEMAIGNDEVAAMLLRQAHEGLSGLAREDIDEQVLERIFANFCIGK
jgi:tRNA modification GTPase